MLRLLRIPFALAACSLIAFAAAGVDPGPISSARRADEEIVKEFKKYFRKYKDTPTRVEAILALEHAGTPDVVKVLVPILKDKEPKVAAAATRVLSSVKDVDGVAQLVAELEDASSEPVQLGLLQVIAAIAPEEARPILIEALEDKSWQVRWRAVEATVALGGEAAWTAVLPLCRDGEVGVRCAALDGLTKLRAPQVVEPAIAALGDDSWEVRASSIAALSSVRDKRSIDPLLALMESEEGRLAQDIADALTALTGRGFGLRRDGWMRWWERNRERFELPTDEELKRLAARRAEIAEEYAPANKGVAYHGIETPSRKLLFVIDVSGSMENLVVDTEPFKDGGYPSYSRMDIVKTELQRTIEGLESYVEFNVLSFATDLKAWKKKLVSANVLNKSSAGEWAKRLEPLGGHSRDHLAQAGLVGSANMEAGKTNTHAALMWALGASGKQGVDDYEVDVDTIFFLSDGRPSHGEFVHERDILEEVRRANELRKVVIHTIAIGRFQKDFMRQLAQRHGGVFVDLEPE